MHLIKYYNLSHSTIPSLRCYSHTKLKLFSFLTCHYQVYQANICEVE